MPDYALAFLIYGFVMGIVYDFFRFLRFVFKNKAASFLLDFLFFAVYALVFFILLLGYNNGIVRAMYFTVYFLGLLVYVFTLFRLTRRMQSGVAAFLRKIIKKFVNCIKKLLQLPKRLYYNVFMLSKKPLRKKRKAKGKKSGEKNEKVDKPVG